MFQMQKGYKFSQIGVGLIIALMAFAALGQTQTSDIRELLPNQPLERELAGGQTHVYRVALKANEFLQVRVEQKGVDVVVRLFDANGKQLAEMDSPNGTQGFEILTFIVAYAGVYTVEVGSLEANAAKGDYTIFLETPRAATERDRKTSQAKAVFSEAQALFNQKTTESYRAAREKFLAASRLYREIGDKSGEAESLVQAGVISDDLGEKQKALDYYNQSLPVFRAVGDKVGEATMLNNIGFVYNALGENQKALGYYKQALPLFQAIPYKHGEAATLNNTGNVYFALGEKQKALDYYNQSLLHSRAVGDKYSEATTLGSIGGVYSALGELQKALEFINQSLRLFRATGRKPHEAIALSSIGTVYFALGEKQKALDYYHQSLSLHRAIGYRGGEATMLDYIGALYSDLGEKQKALEYFQNSLLLSKAVGDKNQEATTLDNLQKYWNSLNNRALAIVFGKQSVNVYQQLRSNIKGFDKSIQQTYLKTVEGTYRTLADLLVGQGRFAEAEQVLAMLKEDEFFDFVRRDADEIKNLKQRVSLNSAEQKLIERYNLLADRITAIGAEFQRLDDKKRKLPEGASLPADEQKRYDELTAQLSDANAAFKLFLEKELVAELGKPAKKEIDIDRALQEKLRQWGEGTVALYTIAGEDRYRVVLTTPTIQVDGKTEIKSADLNKKVFEFRRALQNPAVDPRSLGKEIYDIIVKPIEKDLRAAGAKTLIWSLDGTLRYVPLAALSPDGKTYMVEKYQNVVVTSTTRQSLLAENERVWRTLGLGVSTAQTVPDPVLSEEKISFSALPGVKTELEKIVRDEQSPKETGLILGKRLIDTEFNAKNFGDSLTKEIAGGKRKYTIVHIASHFRLGDDSAKSFLLLGGGNTLTLEQISNSPQMRFGNVELVTLSACNTAFAGGDSTGKEVDSLATFIELRGAKAILATLWSVADESTSLVMSEFYRLRKEKPELTKAEAIQQAQLAMIEGRLKPTTKEEKNRAELVGGGQGASGKPFVFDKAKPFAHPYYWSPFVLIGNWR